MFDSHCHPTDIEDPIGVITGALAAGVQSLLACGYNGDSNRAVVELRQRFPSLPISLGIHPWFANEPTAGLKELIRSMNPAAIGECGLDFAPGDDMPSEEVQTQAFEFQLDLAESTGRPLTIHSRRAVHRVFELANAFPKAKGILHAFGGSFEQARQFVDIGWLIGIGGAVTRAGARRVRGVAQRLPLDAFVLETDAPAIGLEGVNPPHVRPAHLGLVARAIAQLREQDELEIIESTNRNVSRLLGAQVLTPIVNLNG